MKEKEVKDVDFKKVLGEARGLMRILYKAGMINKEIYKAVKNAQKEYGTK